MQAINQQAENVHVKTIGACTETGYRPADRQMAMFKLLAPALKQAIDQQADKCYVKTIDACTETGCRPADRQMAMIKL